MNENEIVKAAQERKPLPDDADMLDCALCGALVDLYNQFDAGKYPAEMARHKKAKLIAEYKRNKLQYAIFADQSKRMIEINKMLDEAERNGCEYAPKLKKVFYGIA